MPFVDQLDTRIYYEVEPAPERIALLPTLIFHHGVAANIKLWNGWLPYLKDRYRLVRFDMRGCGRSTVPEPGFAWSFETLAADVLAVANAASAGKFHFVGESLGGTVGLYLAIHCGDRLCSLTVSNGAPRGGLVQNLAGWRDIIETKGQKAWADQMMDWRFFPGALPQEKFDWFHDQHATCSPDAALAIADLLATANLSSELGRIKVPTLLLGPDASPFIPVTVMAEMKQQIPDCELQVFAHTRHGLPLSHDAACAQVLRDFLARILNNEDKT
jgi:pimeloyl-ACP methyl ester carboxylesterase